jgi:hypothetical protein
MTWRPVRVELLGWVLLDASGAPATDRLGWPLTFRTRAGARRYKELTR